jgi:hypothetical protein
MVPTLRSLQWLAGEQGVAGVLSAAASSGPSGRYQRG